MDNSLKILESVNQFYSQSFSQLINITVAVLAFVGIVIPILIALYQKRIFNLEHKNIESSIHEKLKEEYQEKVNLIRNEFKEREDFYEKRIKEIEKKIASDLAHAKGGIFQVQANAQLKDKAYSLACESYIDAALLQIDSEDNLNLQRSLNQMIDSCFPKLFANEFSEDSNLVVMFKKLIERLNKYNSKGQYSDQIQDLKRAYQNASTRQ